VSIHCVLLLNSRDEVTGRPAAVELPPHGPVELRECSAASTLMTALERTMADVAA
jgi:hypothetical protein